MAVGKGKFQLYTRIDPPLSAGEWRLRASQNLEAQAQTGELTPEQLKIDEAEIHFRVKSPRYQLPPDQLLSTFPPANSFGNYGSRLPQAVIKRRTLPWERTMDGAPEGTPWLALVVIAEGEARLETGVDIADCVTPGVTLSGVADVEKGNCLVVRKSVIDKVFPTQNDLPLLAHAREVDISDTELMMGDDDGFLAVVIANRLPLPAKDDDGNEVPVKYLACLINLENQFDALLERSPDPAPLFFTQFVTRKTTFVKATADYDHINMGTAGASRRGEAIARGPASRAEANSKGSSSYSVASGVAASKAATSASAKSQWSTASLDASSSIDLQLDMARDFNIAEAAVGNLLDPEYRFPVLVHWRFTSTESTTFRSLMENLDSGLLGDVGEKPAQTAGRMPLEVVETGHVGLEHKTREGDEVRSWYRGPLLPHPTTSDDADRLPLAHSSDQLRIVVPDGREDLSLASAFEVGRLLALSRPSMVAALLRWRQQHYQAARLSSLVEAKREVWETILGKDFVLEDLDALGPLAGRFLVDAIVKQPETFLGAPRPRVTAGRPIPVDGPATDVLGKGLGLGTDLFRGDLDSMLEKVRKAEVPKVDLVLKELGTREIHARLDRELDIERVDLVSNALANRFVFNPVAGPVFPPIKLAPTVIAPDALDAILAAETDNEDEDQP